jgi:hypothetical protein
MTGPFDAVIAELRAQREKIDNAITALDELNGSAKGQGPRAKSVKAPKAQVSGRMTRKVDPGGSSVQDLVIGVLKSGPKRPGAVIKALKGKANDASVYTMLSYLKAKGITHVNEDCTHEITE